MLYTGDMISFDDFKKVEMAVGKILLAEKVPETDKLLKLMVDFGGNTNYPDFIYEIADPRFDKSDRDEFGTNIRMITPQTPPLREGEGENPSLLQKVGLPLEKGELKKERDIRQIISGISLHFPDPQVLVGKKCMFVTNIPPRMIKGLPSNGMILALSTDDGKFSLLEPNDSIPEGTRAR